MQFGQSSEKLSREIEQLELELDTLHEDQARETADRPAVVQRLIEKPYRKPLPDHLPREEEVHEPACTCPNCGGSLRKLGEDITEVLDYVPASFKVIRHVRPKLSCRVCETIVQAPMPSLPIERGKPGAGLLAHVLVSKYADHLPLYRQSDIYAREGVDLERSTLADWVGRSAALLDPLVEALRRDVLSSSVLHGDDISARSSPASQIIPSTASKNSCRGTGPTPIRSSTPRSAPDAYAQAKMAYKVSAVPLSLTIMTGLPLHSSRAVSSLVTR